MGQGRDYLNSPDPIASYTKRIINYCNEIESLLSVITKWKVKNFERAENYEHDGDMETYRYARGRAEALEDVEAMLKDILNKEDM